jgi:hypothetical protein
MPSPWTRTEVRGFSFSLSRFLGIAGFKWRIAKATGIPTTTSGLERKLGRIILSLLGLK